MEDETQEAIDRCPLFLWLRRGDARRLCEELNAVPLANADFAPVAEIRELLSAALNAGTDGE